MKNFYLRFVLSVSIASFTLLGCNSSQESPQSSPPSTPPAQVQTAPPPPPQPQQLSLYMVPLNPSDFSMQAIQELKKRGQENPEDVSAFVGLADANFMISRYDVARDFYEKALKVDEGHTEARISLANCLLFLREPGLAIQQLNQLLALNQDYPEALYNKGLILLNSKQDIAGTKEAWTKLVTQHPDHTLTPQVQAELQKL